MSIKHTLLAELTRGPATASALQHSFAVAMDELWPLNIGQVAQTLTRLERDGLVERSGTTTGPTGRKAELYAITSAGRAELDSWWTTAIARPANDRDELVMKVALAAQRPDVNLLTVLDNQRFATLQAVRELTAVARTLPHTRSAQRLAAEHQIFTLEAQLRWLDRVEALSASTSNSASASPSAPDSPEQDG
ncbi:PadR family transcriptional regulator [uncultured Corynebacterium sp.]|uniref:PadR family transcriptional regulator n=1 Tax=uncultured Corynebacterium sp. TaxID=159447 RepID=UPI0025D5DA40|nr:PadR family transcriptional regulator [uncultured Corynebacterium sp.]